MKKFVCFAVCFVVGLFACQQVNAQDINKNPAAIPQPEQLVVDFAEWEKDCHCCRTPVRSVVKGVVKRTAKAGHRTMGIAKNSMCRARTMVRNTACRTRCATKRVLSNARRLTQRVFRGGCGCN